MIKIDMEDKIKKVKEGLPNFSIQELYRLRYENKEKVDLINAIEKDLERRRTGDLK